MGMGGLDRDAAHRRRPRRRVRRGGPRLLHDRSQRPSEAPSPHGPLPGVRAVLGLHGLHVRAGVRLHGRRVRNSQERGWWGNMGVLHADMVMKSIIPIIMAGVLGIYGLIVAVLLGSSITADENYSYSTYSGFSAMAAGMCCGMAGLAAGVAIGVVGDAGVRCNARQPKLFVGVILILIFAEALGLYGLIVALILQSNKLECIDVSSSYFVTSDGTTTADTNCLG